MQTYTTLDGRVLDLSELTPAERVYLRGRYEAYLADTPYEAFWPTTSGPGNPLVEAAGGRITNAVWDHPLYQAVHDLEDRLGVRQGEMAPDPGDDIASDPLADDWVSVPDAAARKGVAPTAVHKAIRRGQLIARPAQPGGKWLVVSANSLARWMPSAVRQEAARRSRRSRVAAPASAA